MSRYFHCSPFSQFTYFASWFIRQQQHFRVFRALLLLVPGLEERIITGDDADLVRIADLVRSCVKPSRNYHINSCQIQKGASSARSDDTKSLKSPIIDWITLRDQPLRPTLSRSSKIDRGFNHERTGALLCPVEYCWNDPEFVSFLSCASFLNTHTLLF